MANEKITELTALTSGSVAGTDVLPIVDISDTSVSATGQTKKITQEALFDSGTSMPSLVEVGTITTGTWTGTTLGVGYGGTGLASFTSGDILYASGTTTLAKLAKGSDGDTLTLSSGVPAWSSASGDITGVTAGTNLNGGGTSGAVTLNVDNPVVADLTGDVTGDLTGDSAGTHTGAVTGNVTGNVTGDVTGDLTGDVTGDVTGSSGSCTGNAATVTNGVYTTNNLSVLAATTSAQLAGVISDETGSGSLVFATSPTLVTPALGTPASGVLTNCTGTASGLTAGTVTTNANLTGEVTSSGNATTIADDIVDEANLKVSNAPTNGHFLSAQSGDTGGLTWAAASGGGGISWDGSTTNGVATFKDADEATVEANLTFDGTDLAVGSGTSGLQIGGTSTILVPTSDASADGVLHLCGGGAASNGRGAYIRLYGNEHDPHIGGMIIKAGVVTGANMTFNVNDADVFKINQNGGTVNTLVLDNGNCGIGTANPAEMLHVAGDVRIDTDIYIQPTNKFYLDGGNDTFISEAAANEMAFSTAGSEVMRLSSGGNVGVGGVPTAGRIHTIGSGADQNITVEATDDSVCNVYLDSDRSTAGYVCGRFGGQWNGTHIGNVSIIAGADTTNKDDGELGFFTASGGVNIERARINSSGYFGVGRTVPECTLDVQGGTPNLDVGDDDDTQVMARFQSTSSPRLGTLRIVGTNLPNENSVAFVSDSSPSSESGFAFYTVDSGSGAGDKNRSLSINGRGQIHGMVESTTSADASDVTFAVNFGYPNLQKLTLHSGVDNELELTGTGHLAGATVKLYVDASAATPFTLVAPSGWEWMGADLPSSWSGGNFILNLTSWGTSDSDVTVEVFEVAS